MNFTSRIYYGWVVVFTMFWTMFIVLGFRFSFGVFYVAILEDTGWSRAETASIFSVAMVVYMFMAMLSGILVDHVGPRIMFPVSSVIFGVGLILCAGITSINQFFLYYGLIVGTSFAFLGFIPHMAIIPTWFETKRGLASGVTLAGSGLGSLFLTLAANYLIREIGWRQTFWIMGIVFMAILVPLNILLHKKSPQSLGLFKDGGSRPKSAGIESSANGLSVSQVLRKPAFWLLFLGVMLIGVCIMTLVVHQTRMTIDFGFSLTVASFFFGTTGLLRSVGGVTLGPLSDRIGRSHIIAGVTVLSIISFLFLRGAMDTPHIGFLVGFAVLFGFAYNGMTPVYAAIVSDLFPGKNIGKVFGLLDQGFGLGSASGPWIAGLIFDHTGNYEWVIWGLMGAVGLTGILLMSAIRVGRSTSFE